MAQPQPRHPIVDADGAIIGRAGNRRIYMLGNMPETVLEAMIGRRLVEVLSRHDFGRDVRILEAFNLPTERGILKLSGRALLPTRIVEKRSRRAAKEGSS